MHGRYLLWYFTAQYCEEIRRVLKSLAYTSQRRPRRTSRMATHLTQQKAPPKTEIPDKLYFRIGEVARLCSVAPYVLRFWESEFSQLKPNKSGTGQRLYRRRDVEMALRVKRLLYDEGYTIAGARQAIQAETRSKRSGQPELPLPQQQQQVQRTEARLHKVRKELREILSMLSVPVAQIPEQARERTLPVVPAKPGLFEL
jgi:DNA-binding transcriptional MerR regulator